MSYRTHRTINIVLAVLYWPISLFGFLLGMATEGTIGETNRLIIASCYTLAHLGMLTPLAAYVGLLFSHKLFEKGSVRASHFARFLGLIVLASAILLGGLLDRLGRLTG